VFSYLAGQLSGALKADPAKWEAPVRTMMAFYPPGSPIPLGIEVQTKDTTPALEALAWRLLEIFGENAVHVFKDDKMSADQFAITIFYKPR
jgi:hypothetical protein